MNEEQLIEFINWLPTAVPEFQNATPEQIVQTLNQLYESEEGQATLSQLFTAFQESKNEPQSQMFKKGGKMAAFVNKYGNGGCVSCKKKEILRGGMVNKVAEKMQNGGDIISASSLGYNPYTIMDKIGTSGGLQQPAGKKAIRSIILDNAQQNGQILSRKDLRQQTNAANFVNRAQEGLIGENRLNKLLPKNLAIVNAIPVNQNGGELATMTSAETANNIGLIPKAQGGNDTTDWHTNSILEVLPQMRFARRRTYGPGFVDEMSAYSDSLDNATLGRLIMPNPTSGQQDTTYFRFFNNPMAEPVYMPLTGNTKRQVDAKFDNTLKKSKNK